MPGNLAPPFLRIALAAFLGHALCAATPAALQILTETAPAGGWAQIKIYAVKPMAISNGHLILNLDAAAFGPGPQVGLFGANGDALGVATVTGSQVDVQFSSATGGIGQLAGLPVMVISVPVLASAGGRTVVVSAASPDSSVSVTSGSLAVQGTLSVSRIAAGVGVVPAGAVVPVAGTGFTPSTKLTIDGVAIASTRLVSPQQIDVNLGGATGLTGKRLRATDNGVEFDYFCFQPGDPVNFPENTRYGSVVADTQPLFPLFASTGAAAYSGYVGGVIEVQNPNSSAATVNLANVSALGQTLSRQTVSIPAGSWAILDGWPRAEFVMTSDQPVRSVAIVFCGAGVALPVCPVTPFPLNPSVLLGIPAPVLTPASLLFTWQRASAALPAARTVKVALSTITTLTAAASTDSGQPWLSVSVPAQLGNSLSVSVDPSQLAAGTYHGSVVVTPGFGPPATLPVTLTVTDAPVTLIAAAPTSLTFTSPAFNAPPYTQTVALTSHSGPAAFSVAVEPGSWLKVSPMSGTTPATLTVTWDPAVTSQIYYQPRSTPASILISAPGNALTIAAAFNVTGVQTFQTFLGESGTGPNGLIFSAQTGTPPQTQTINVDPAGAITAAVDQPWMHATAPTPQTVAVTADPAGLLPGVYHGAVTVGEPGIASKAVPVTFGVWSTPPPLSVTTHSFTFVRTVGGPSPPYQTALVDSGGVPVPLTILNGTSWLNVVNRYNAPTPANIGVGIANGPESPGEYDGSFTIQSPGNSIYEPVTFLVEPAPAAPPVLSQVVNAASGIAGSVSPGEILSIRGYGAGASPVSGLKLDESGLLASNLNGLEVTFDGQPAPLLFTSANQTNLVVPYEIAGKATTVLQVKYAAAARTLATAAWVLPVSPAAPGIFTVDATGTGQGAVLNQDNSVNGAANPAARNSVISIYATGEGQTSPPGVTGSVSSSNTKSPLLPVTVTIGGVGATVQYAGSAPLQVSGLLQVNAVVPPGVTPGSAVPVTVSVGEAPSQTGVTIAVK